jgi:hypothetical protein
MRDIWVRNQRATNLATHLLSDSLWIITVLPKTNLCFFLLRNLRFPLESVDDLEHLTDLWNSKGEDAIEYIHTMYLLYFSLLQFEE